MAHVDTSVVPGETYDQMRRRRLKPVLPNELSVWVSQYEIADINNGIERGRSCLCLKKQEIQLGGFRRKRTDMLVSQIKNKSVCQIGKVKANALWSHLTQCAYRNSRRPLRFGIRVC